MWRITKPHLEDFASIASTYDRVLGVVQRPHTGGSLIPHT